MGLYNTFATNRDAEVSGVWQEFPANDDGTVPGFLVARMGRTNPEYQAAVERLAKKYKRDIELEILDNKTADPVFREVFVDTVLRGWRNVQDANGKEIPFSKENALKLFEDLPDLYDYLVNKAKALATFRDIEVETAAGK